VKEFADPRVGAVQGRVVVLNEPQNIVARLVAFREDGGYPIDQAARDRLGLITQLGGTVGGFRHSLLKELGGWDEKHARRGHRFNVQSLPFRLQGQICFGRRMLQEAVETWRAYWKQRYRWARGHMQCAFKHTLKLLKSDKLTVAQKIDVFLLLNIYFMPVIILLSWIISISLVLTKSCLWNPPLWTATLVSMYSAVGNFAPFYKVGVGVYLDGRSRTQ